MPFESANLVRGVVGLLRPRTPARARRRRRACQQVRFSPSWSFKTKSARAARSLPRALPRAPLSARPPLTPLTAPAPLSPGVDAYDVNLETQKVTVKGSVTQEEVIERIAKTGKAVEPWSD